MEIYNDIESIRKRIYRAFFYFLEQLQWEIEDGENPRLVYDEGDELYSKEIRDLETIYLELDVEDESYRLYTYDDEEDIETNIRFTADEDLKITRQLRAIIYANNNRDYDPRWDYDKYQYKYRDEYD